MIIAIPSAGRPAGVFSQKIFPDAYVYVPENEVRSYSVCGVSNVVAVPEHVIGIVKTRNWILDQNPDDDVVFIDDDVNAFHIIGSSSQRPVRKNITTDELKYEFARLFVIADLLNFPVFSISENLPNKSPSQEPIELSGRVTTSCIGVIGSSIRFDEDIQVMEDYEISMRCSRDFGGVLIVNYVKWNSDKKSSRFGGCTEYKNPVSINSAILAVNQKYE